MRERERERERHRLSQWWIQLTIQHTFIIRSQQWRKQQTAKNETREEIAYLEITAHESRARANEPTDAHSCSYTAHLCSKLPKGVVSEKGKTFTKLIK